MKTRLLTFLLFIFFLACKNNEISPGPTVTFIDEPGLPEVTRLFVPLARSVWDIALNDEARAVVYQEVDKQFDGDYNVLLKTLVHSGQGENRTIEKEALTMLKARIDDFNVGAKETVFPQIFIPFFEKLKEDNLLGKKEPLLVFRDGPPAKNGLYRGYAFIDGKLADKGLISEKHASENEVWVISVNERVDKNGNPAPFRVNSYTQSIISQLTIKEKSCLKEDWIGGKADVNAIRWFDNIYNTAPDAKFYGDEAPKGDRVANVSRRSAKNSTVQYLHFDFITGWTDPSYAALDFAYYVIFEYDPWPAGKPTVNFGNLQYQYRSYESYYDKNSIHRNSADNYSVNNGCINWVMD